MKCVCNASMNYGNFHNAQVTGNMCWLKMEGSYF